MRAAGFVLVGGDSSRMGHDKALLPFRSFSLVESIAAEVMAATGNVTLVGRPDRYRHLKLDSVSDLRPGLGPLAGIEAALKSGKDDFNLIVSCDMPGIARAWLVALLRCAEETGARCVVSEDIDNNVYPLCAVYRSECLSLVQKALDEKRLKLSDTVSKLNPFHLRFQGTLSNVNTPEDWRRWQQHGESFSITGALKLPSPNAFDA